MTRWSLRSLCLASTLLALCQLCARAYLVNPWTAREWASGFFTNKCHPIPKNLTLCYGIGYDQMRLPNLLNHESVDEVIQQSNIWNLLGKTKCHDDLRIFLCSLYAPVCLKEAGVRHIIKPCRSLCRVVRDNCLPRMRRFGYEWPDIARCDKFPDEKRNNLCIPPRELQQKATPTCQYCDQTITYENIISSFCMADVVLKGKMKSHRVDPTAYLFNIHKKRRYFRAVGLSRDQKRTIGGQLRRSNGCVCPQLAKARRHDKWLIMGRRDPATGRLEIFFLSQWQRHNRSFKKATRAIRKQKDICRKQQYSFMSNSDLSLPRRPTKGRQQGSGRRRAQSTYSDRYFEDRPVKDKLQLLEGPTQWAPPRLSGRRNNLFAQHLSELRSPAKPLVRPQNLPQQLPTVPQGPMRPPSLERPSQQSPMQPSQGPSPTLGQRPNRIQPQPTNQRPTVLGRPSNQKTVPPTAPQPTRQRPKGRRGKQRKGKRGKKRDGKKREGKKRDGKKRRKKQRGNKRRKDRKNGRRKNGKRRGDKAEKGSKGERDRKRKRKRKKEDKQQQQKKKQQRQLQQRDRYFKQYYGLSASR